MYYLKLPTRNSAPAKTLRLMKNGELLLDLSVRYDSENPEYSYYYPVTEDGVSVFLDGVDNPKVTTCPAPEVSENESAEKYRPKFHFTAQAGWLNDPNGLLYYRGRYHMFFQYNPVGSSWGNMHWGHAVSEDLVHWEELGIALFPDKLGTMFSGSGIVDHENASGLKTGDDDPILLFYTAAGGSSVLSAGQKFTQCMAYSTDGGMTFHKYDKNPVIPHIKADNRDPKVVRDGVGGYFCVFYLDGNTYALWHSDNLLNWSPLQTLTLPGDGECPDFYPLPFDGKIKWVFSGASDRYLTGDIVGGKFVPDSPDSLRLHYGRGSYASQTWSDVPDGRRLRVAWNRWETINPAPLSYWSSMTTPTEMALKKIKNKACLTVSPAAEVRDNTVKRNCFTDISLSKNDAMKIFPCSGTCVIDIEFIHTGPFLLWINGYKVEYDGDTLTCGGRPASLPDKLSDLTLISDSTSVEAMACGGSVYFGDAFLPDDKTALAIKPLGAVKIKSLTVSEF